MGNPLVHVVAALIFNDNDEILITKRAEGSHLAGFWEFPGGRIEKNEQPEGALMRELKEETDLDIKVGALFWHEVYDYDIKTIDIRFYLCEQKNPEQKVIPREIADYRWANRRDLNQFTFPPADADLIRRLSLEEKTIP